MKQSFKLRFTRLAMVSAMLATAMTSVSCVTTYDASGRPVQTVDPGMAVAGVAAAGLIGYALSDNDHHHRGGYYGGGGGYYGGGRGYYRPYPRHGGYCR